MRLTKLFNIHFIISHENPFYLASTTLPTLIYEAQKEKEALLKEHDITIYRCHDLWDVYPEYGIRDSWAKTLDLNFEESHDHSYYRYTHDINMSVEECAQHIINRIKPYHQQGIEVIGDKTSSKNVLTNGNVSLGRILHLQPKEVLVLEL